MEVTRIVVALSLAPLLSQCVSARPEGHVSPPRIALVGDSWPLLMRHHQGFKRALVDEGYSPQQVRNVAIGWNFLRPLEARLAYKGIESYRYAEPRYLDALDHTLEKYPTIEVIHLSLGGADLLHDMPPNVDAPAQESFIRGKVLPNIDIVLTHLQEKFPDKHIALVSYDYLNFRDTRARNRRAERCWEKLGEPEPVRMNEIIWRFTELQREFVRQRPGVEFIDYLGKTKARVGVVQNLSEPTPRDLMWIDGMHLSRASNTALARFCLDRQYNQWLFPLRDTEGRPMVPELSQCRGVPRARVDLQAAQSGRGKAVLQPTLANR